MLAGMIWFCSWPLLSNFKPVLGKQSALCSCGLVLIEGIQAEYAGPCQSYSNCLHCPGVGLMISEGPRMVELQGDSAFECFHVLIFLHWGEALAGLYLLT